MRLLEHLVDRLRDALAGRPAPGREPLSPDPLRGAQAGAFRGVRAGLVQPDRTTCGSACLVVARMLGDADYARWLGTGEVTGRPRDPRPQDRRFADEVLATHVRTNRWYGASGALQVAWPRALGTAPWALAHELTVTGGTSPPGTRHRVRSVSPRRRGEAYDAVVHALALGHAVPLYVGNRSLPRHVVLVVGPVIGGDDAGLTAYDPATGRPATITRDAFERGDLRLSGWSEPWFAVLPAGRTAH
ncbi:hypothetical protein Pve01_82910 [Planomonospora venezuelensis]|nr:hypothetical protein Pve01_82910 [Planomonospora venezuelensis]